MYSWKPRPDDPDKFIASDMPQPVAALVNGIPKILIFTNYHLYPSAGINNNFNGVRVGEITPPGDTYGLTSHVLAGRRRDFAVANLANAAGNAHAIYLFGGHDAGADMADIHAYTPGLAGGFSPVPFNLPGPRSGMAAVSALGKIYLFGGLQNGTVVPEIWVFDPAPNAVNPLAKVAPLTPGFHGARAMTKAIGPKHYIYLVGARMTGGSGPTYEIRRFDPQTNTMKVLLDKDDPSEKLIVPNAPATPTISWDPRGAIRILAGGDFGLHGTKTWGKIDAWILTDQIGGTNDGHAALTAAPYDDPARARDMFGAVKAGPATYIIGGTYGHGPTLQDRSRFVDKLDSTIVKAVQTKIL